MQKKRQALQYIESASVYVDICCIFRFLLAAGGDFLASFGHLDQGLWYDLGVLRSRKHLSAAA